RVASTSSARHAFDLGAHQALDHLREILVEPGLEHRPQQFAHQLLDRATAARLCRSGERIESGNDRGGGRGGEKAALLDRGTLRVAGGGPPSPRGPPPHPPPPPPP